jgi:basic membrane protein A
MRVGTKFITLALVAGLVMIGSFWGAAPARSQRDYSVALIIAQGGLGDRSYNDAAFAGLTQAATQLGVTVVPVQSADPIGEAEELLRTTAEAGFDLVITLETAQADILAKVASEFPKTTFVIMSAVVNRSNVVSVTFDEHVGAFLAGALAAMVTTDPNIAKTNPAAIVGAVGGEALPSVDTFIYGYWQGACAVVPNITLLTGYVGGFDDITRGRAIADDMIDDGADVIFQVAGGSGIGVIEAAKENDVFAIGVDSDQDYLAPGSVLTSVIKPIDTAVYEIVQMGLAGDLVGGQTLQFQVAEDSLGLTDMVYTRQFIPARAMQTLNGLKADIMSGDVFVVDIRELPLGSVVPLEPEMSCDALVDLTGGLMAE